MSDQLITGIVTVFMAITGVALIAVLVSKNANTAGVAKGVAGGYATALGAALSPVTGGGGFGSFGGFGGAGLSLSNM